MNAARHAKSSSSTCSWRAWAPSPRGPSPSKSRNPDRGRKIPVRAASRGAFRQILPKLAGHLAGYSIETNHGGVAFKRRAIDAALELEPRARQHAGAALAVLPRRSAASSMVETRTSMLARATSATTFVREPPAMRPTLSVTPREQGSEAR